MDVNEQSLSTSTQLTTKENVQTTAKNLYNFEGGLHIGLDQSGTGIEGDFFSEKINTLQSGAESDIPSEAVSTNTQSMAKENVQTTAKNLYIFEGGLHIGLDQSGTPSLKLSRRDS